MQRAGPPSASARARQFLLLPFRNVTRAPAQEWLVSGGPLMLGTALGQYQNLEVVPEEKLVAAMRRASLPTDVAPDAVQLRRIAEETGGWTAVSGTVLNTGGKLRITVQALDIATTKVLTRAEGEVSTDADVRLAFDTLAGRLLTITGLTSQGGVDLGALTTRSIPAYRSYIAGMDALRRANGREAITAFTEAVKLDSTFAIGWARLALSLALWDAAALSSPFSPLFRAVDNASRHARALPPREARLVRALQLSLSARFGAARAVLDSAVIADPSDLEAREYLALTELRDFVLTDTSSAHPKMRGSRNRAAALLEGILERDPKRGSAFNWLALLYGELVGHFGGQPAIPGLKADAPSLAALLSAANALPMIPVLRDSIEMMSIGAWSVLDLSARRVMYGRAAERGLYWADRWIAAMPDEGAAHWSAFIFSNALGDYTRALKELELSGSAAMSSRSATDRPVGRAKLLLALGRTREGTTLADSVRALPNVAPGSFDAPLRVSIAGRVLEKRWADAVALIDTAAARAGAANQVCQYAAFLLGSDWQGALPLAVRTAIMDTVALNYSEVLQIPRLAPCMIGLATGLRADSIYLPRPRQVQSLFAKLDSIERTSAPDTMAAYALGTMIARMDSASWPLLKSREIYMRFANEISVLRRFDAGSARVSGDSVIVTWKWIGPTPARWDVPGAHTGWTLRARTIAGPGAGTATVTFMVERGPSRESTQATGGIAEIAAAAVQKLVHIQGTLAGIPPVIGFSTQRTGEVRVEGNELRLIVRGDVAAALRQARPATMQFGIAPCGAITGGLCSWPTVQIEYR